MSVRQTFEPLTKRQREVLDLLVRGRTNYEIAQQLGISLDGAKWHVREVLARLGVDSREQAAEVWRRERSWWGRGGALLTGLVSGAAAKFAVAGAAAVLTLAAVAGVIYLGGDDGDPAPAGMDATATPVNGTPTAAPDDLAPRSGIPIVDQVIDIATRGDLPAFRALMKEFPEPCTTAQRGVGSPPACPPGAAEGTPVDTFRAIASERVDQGPDLDQVLQNLVPNLTTLHGVATPQADTFGGVMPPWNYEVIVYGTTSVGGQTWAAYLLDGSGIVGLYSAAGFAVFERGGGVPDDEWLVAPITTVDLKPDKDIYVVGRDGEIRFEASLPPVCAGKPVVIRLYAYPAPGVSGGIQVPSNPALAVEAWTVAAAPGAATVAFKLPPSLASPTQLRPGILSHCLSDIAVQGEVELALLAPPADAEVATFEVLGSLLDQPAGSAPTVAEFMGGELTAAVSGFACQTVSLTDKSIRNERGNVVFRVGADGQPAACRAPGATIEFVMTATGDPNNPSALSTTPEYVPGTIRLIRNYGPEPPHRAPRAPLITQ